MGTEEAGELLGLSQRQIRRLKKGVESKGTDALKHGNKGRLPATTVDEALKADIVVLYKTKYPWANFQHFTELLEENEGITVSITSVKRILGSAGIKSPKSKRKPKKHRRRARKGHAGELVQTDATPHDFFGTGVKVCLHGTIDDATGEITGLYMTENECLEGYFNVFEQMIENFGIPAGVYADRHTIFASPKADKLTIEDELAGVEVKDTQLGRAMRELGITLIWARSPQAKGRIERLWGTLQDRLTGEFKIHGIATLEAANGFLPGYIKRYNHRFGVGAHEAVSFFVPNTQDLTSILCVRQMRTIDSSGAFSFHGQKFVVDGEVHPGVKVEVIAHRKQGIFVLHNQRRYPVVRIQKPIRKNAIQTPASFRSYPPLPDSHPYKHGKSPYVQYSGEYNDTEIMAIIRDIFDKDFKSNGMTLRKGGAKK
jgi:transposase